MTAEQIFLEKDYNCAESILRLFNERYALGLDEKALKLAGGFGGGIGCGNLCGCLAAAISVLSCLKIKERAHEDPDFKLYCAAFLARFEEHFGSTLCGSIKPRYATPEQRCLRVVKETEELLEQYLQETAAL